MGVDLSGMISNLEANGHLMLTTAQIGDLMDIDSRIKNGDESGWRGDPTMGIFINRHTGMFEVWGIDRAGNQYLAASHDKLDHTLLIKLREGDPTKHDVFQRVLDKNQKMLADAKAKEHERFAEVGDKLQWAIKRDHGQHMGGRRRMYAVSDSPERTD